MWSKSKKKSEGSQHTVSHVDEQSGDTTDYPLFVVWSRSKVPPIEITVRINDTPLTMEVDTGASLTLIPEQTLEQVLPNLSLSPSDAKLCAYMGKPIPVLGVLQVSVQYQGQQATLPLQVIRCSGPSLFGRNWLDTIRLDWHNICHASCLSELLSKYRAVFEEDLGTLKDFKASIDVDPKAKPRFCKSRSIPYAMRDLVTKELQRLVSEGILEPVQFSDWASPIVAVLKEDRKSVRLCGDFKQTINPVCKLGRYPLPKIEDLFARLSGGKTFTKLDLSQAYQQLTLDEASKKFVVINTPQGLFQYTRLPYGISSYLEYFSESWKTSCEDFQE